MPYRSTDRTRARAARRRELLLDAAARLVAVDGWRGLTIAAVAREAGISTGNVYGHVPDKAALLAETFRSLAEREYDAVADAVSAAGPGAADGIATLVDVFAGRSLSAPRVAWALLAEPADPAVEAARLHYRGRYVALLATLVETGISRGELPPQLPALTASAIVGAVGEALVGPLSDALPRTEPSQSVPELRALCLRAVGAPENSAPQTIDKEPTP